MSLPIVDFGPFFNGSLEERREVGKEMIAAMRDVGFMLVVNHGISVDEIQQVFDWSAKFFHLKEAEKAKCAHPEDGAYHRGWSTVGKEKVTQMVFDKERLEQMRKVPDVKESFDFGNPSAMLTNRWPDDCAIPGFRDFCLDHFAKCDLLCKQFLKAIALGLGLEEEFFLPFHSDSDNQVRLLHYPPTSESDLKHGKAERIGAHTDFGTITMLFQDDVGGLEVRCASDETGFIQAPIIPGAAIINTGDLLMRWSNDMLKSTLHRVGEPATNSATGMARTRYSAPFFVSPNNDAMIGCLPGTYSETKPKKYETISALEYSNMRLRATY